MGRRADHARPQRRARQRLRGQAVKVVSNTAVSLDGRINTRERRFTFFELDAAGTRVSQIWIGRGRVAVG